MIEEIQKVVINEKIYRIIIKRSIWRFFEQEEVGKGHYVAKCLASNQTFRPGKTAKHVSPNLTGQIENDHTTLDDSGTKETIDKFLSRIKSFRCPSGKLLWNFVIHLTDLSNGRVFLWKIGDFSNESLTTEFLAQQIRLILNEVSKNLQNAIKTFNERFKIYDFNEYLLAYYIHPGFLVMKVRKFDIYQFSNTNVLKNQSINLRTWRKEIQYQNIQAIAARIWQQMLKIPDIAAYLKSTATPKDNPQKHF
ncbi:hypothetical protein GLOIN_2v1489170 [Rhizophagus irregularis DAOM 181602=DAOM 197198]|nr:hypothetical protein GLOIN_2v1489170 [Rhizophagus irregularis DAOM 181602=DAOM 197198]